MYSNDYVILNVIPICKERYSIETIQLNESAIWSYIRDNVHFIQSSKYDCKSVKLSNADCWMYLSVTIDDRLLRPHIQ